MVADPISVVPARAALLARLYAQALQARFAPHGVSPAQFQVLQHLWVRDGLTQNELCGLIGIEQPTMANTLKRMDRDGLVRKAQDDNDRRKVRIKLTKRARDLADTLSGSADEVLAVANQGLTDEEQALLERLLVRVADNLAQDLDQDPLILEEAVEPVPEPAVQPQPEPKPEPALAPTPEPEPEPTLQAAPEPEPTPEPEPEPIPVPEPEPMPEPAPASTPEPAPIPTPEPAATDQAAPRPVQDELPLLRPIPGNEPDLLILDEEVVEPQRAPRSQIPLPLDLTSTPASSPASAPAKSRLGTPANEADMADQADAESVSADGPMDELEDYMLLEDIVDDVVEDVARLDPNPDEDPDEDQGPDDPDQDMNVIRD